MLLVSIKSKQAVAKKARLYKSKCLRAVKLPHIECWPSFQIQSKLHLNYCYCFATSWKKGLFPFSDFCFHLCFDIWWQTLSKLTVWSLAPLTLWYIHTFTTNQEAAHKAANTSWALYRSRYFLTAIFCIPILWFRPLQINAPLPLWQVNKVTPQTQRCVHPNA